MVLLELNNCGMLLMVFWDNTMEAHPLGFHSLVLPWLDERNRGATVDQRVDSKNLVAVANYSFTVADS